MGQKSAEMVTVSLMSLVHLCSDEIVTRFTGVVEQLLDEFSSTNVVGGTPGAKEEGTRGGITWGERPRCRLKPEKPVDALMVFIMLNLIRGKAATQPFCARSTW